MARNRRQEPQIKLKQPDRSGPDPTRQTLFDLAEQRGLLKDLDGQTTDASKDADGEPLIGRLGDAILWSISLTIVHFTLDVVVTNQYAIETVWPSLFSRNIQAFPIIFLLFYLFHPHDEPISSIPRLFSPRTKALLHQVFFLVSAVLAGCYLIHITNVHGYYAVMKKAPPVGTIWIWSIVELDLLWALGSLVCFGLFMVFGGYTIM